MKKIILLISFSILILNLTACKKNDNSPVTKTEQVAYDIVNAINKAYDDYYKYTDREPTYNELSTQFNNDNTSIGAKMYYGIISVENTNIKCKDETDENDLYTVTCTTNDTQKQYSTNKLKINTSR